MINNNRLTIGYLLREIADDYDNNCWSGVVAAARQHNVNLLCFAGGILNFEAKYSRQRNKIFNLVSNRNVDGLIAATTLLGRLIDHQVAEKLLKSYSPLPIVSIGIGINDIPSVLVDNSKGMFELVKHLIVVHKNKRIAFIKGPETNDEANIRFNAYQQALRENNIPFDERLVVKGDFLGDSGRRAIVELLDKRKVSFDAVAAANDLMALLAMKEMQKRGYNVPEDVAITGFDDCKSATSIIPPLTTVYQPIFEVGYQAVSTLLKLINGEEVALENVLPTKVIVRNSCGCFIPPSLELGFNSTPVTASHRSATDKQTILSYLSTSAKKEIDSIQTLVSNPGWLEELIEEFIMGIKEPGAASFFNLLNKLMLSTVQKGVKISSWQKIVLSIAELRVTTETVEKKFDHTFSLMKQILLYFINFTEQYKNYEQTRKQETYNALSRINEELVISFKKEDLKALLQKELSIFDINSCFLALYKDRKSSETSTLHLYYHSNAIGIKEGTEFRSEELIPGSLNEVTDRFAYNVIPIVPLQDIVGFVLFDIGIVDGMVYETLVAQLSRSLNREELYDQINKYSTQLEKKVEERTAALEQAQKRLIETAHQAGMVEIAVGILHNTGNVLNSINISVQEISEVLQKSSLQELHKANDLLSSNQENLTDFVLKNPKGKTLLMYYPLVGEALNTEYQILMSETKNLRDKVKMVNETIQMQQAYAQGGALVDDLDLIQTVDSVLRLQINSIHRHSIRVHRDYPNQAMPIKAQKSKLIHTLLNLLKNAEESLSNTTHTEDKLISISIGYNDINQAFISIADNGRGIQKENLIKVFNYGFTTKVNGHGFGLHTCANFMTEMGANIKVSSGGPQQGAIFTITFSNSTSDDEYDDT